MLTRLVYTSASVDLSDAELDRILEVSRKNNAARSISGILLYGEDTFVQILEGPESQIDTLYEKILSDPRHSATEMLLKEPIKERMFGNWAMAYCKMSPEGFQKIGGNVGLRDAKSFIQFAKDPSHYIGDFVSQSYKAMMP